MSKLECPMPRSLFVNFKKGCKIIHVGPTMNKAPIVWATLNHVFSH